jgi:hypothetical protein
VAVVALTAAGACGGGDDAPEDDARATTTVDPTTTIQLTPEEEAEAVYLEFVDTVMRVVTTEPNPDDPDFERLAIDPVLGKTRDNIATMQAENHVVEVGPRTSHRVLSTVLTGSSTVSIRACDVADDRTVDLDDGSVVVEGLVSRLVEAKVEVDEDAWKVSDLVTLERFSGEASCPD